MPTSEILGSVALVIIDISEEGSTSIIRVTRIGELGTLAVTNKRSRLKTKSTNLHRVFQLQVTINIVPSPQILSILMAETIFFSETWVLTRATMRHNIRD
jgi:hypothetical protein